MPRKILVKTDALPYHVVNRSNNKEFFYLPLEELWQICTEVLGEICVQFKVDAHAFVLMSNHYHLIVSTPNSNLGEAMKYFHREVARKANKKSGRINHFFGGRYKWSLIGSENYYWNTVKYVFRNPVSAGACHRVEDYRFSSLNRRADAVDWKMVDFFAEQNVCIDLDCEWLNQPFTPEQSLAIAKGLRRREFALPRDKSGKIVAFEAMRRKKGTVT